VTRALLAVALASVAFGQSGPRGAALFAKTCGAGYCHATGGSGGGAPRLAARGFDINFIRATVTNGVEGTRMAGYAASMAPKDLEAVVGYVASLNGITATGATVRTRRPALTGQAERGRLLFSEATRGFARCTTCHQVAGIGIAVAAPISKVPLNAAALKKLATPGVKTANYAGETIPALVVAQRAQDVSFYDFAPNSSTMGPPVLRTVAPGEVRITDGSAWSHASAIAGYTDPELNAMLAYLRLAARP